MSDFDSCNSIYYNRVSDAGVMDLDLQLFAKDSPTGEKTEAPTDKKIEDSRKEGQVAKSQELNTAIMLLVGFLLLKVWCGILGNQFLALFPESLGKIRDYDTVMSDTASISALVNEFSLDMLKILAIPLAVMSVAAFLSYRFQFSWKVTTKPLQPKMNKISPISGMKRLFSVQTLMRTFVSIAKIAVIIWVVYDEIKDKWNMLLDIYDYELGQTIGIIGNIVINLGIKISVIMLVIGLADYIFQRWKNRQDMMMSKKDIQDEMKNTEGDPQVKGRMRQKMREASNRRMMEDVPKADVIITNPTHYAVAIQYNPPEQTAPVVLAKGTDYLAGKIKDLAREEGIEIVENRALARMLYSNCEVGDEIPQELYQAVAEVLAYVYRIRGRDRRSA